VTIENLPSQAYSSNSHPNNRETSAQDGPRAVADVTINRILECAVILGWKECMPLHAGLIHIEYCTRTDGLLAYVKVWSSIVRGYMDLVCEYFLDPGPFVAAGLSVERISTSSTLAQMLTAVMQNQSVFTKVAEAGKKVVLQVYSPSAADILFAETDWVRCIPRMQNETNGAQEDNANWENEGGRLAA